MWQLLGGLDVLKPLLVALTLGVVCVFLFSWLTGLTCLSLRLYSAKHNDVLEPREALQSVTTAPQHQNAVNKTWWLASSSLAKESLNVIPFFLREESDLHLSTLLSYLWASTFGIFLKEACKWIPPQMWMHTHIWLHVVILSLLAVDGFKYCQHRQCCVLQEELHFPLTVLSKGVSNFSLQWESVAQDP